MEVFFWIKPGCHKDSKLTAPFPESELPPRSMYLSGHFFLDLPSPCQRLLRLVPTIKPISSHRPHQLSWASPRCPLQADGLLDMAFGRPLIDFKLDLHVHPPTNTHALIPALVHTAPAKNTKSRHPTVDNELRSTVCGDVKNLVADLSSLASQEKTHVTFTIQKRHRYRSTFRPRPSQTLASQHKQSTSMKFSFFKN